MAMCKTMRNVVAGGEALTPALAARFRQRLPSAHLHNTYGPTEATIDITGMTRNLHLFCAVHKAYHAHFHGHALWDRTICIKSLLCGLDTSCKRRTAAHRDFPMHFVAPAVGTRSSFPCVALGRSASWRRVAGLDVTEEFKGGASVPIGRPIDNTACYIVDGALQLLPMGVPGELVVSGVQARLSTPWHFCWLDEMLHCSREPAELHGPQASPLHSSVEPVLW